MGNDSGNLYSSLNMIPGIFPFKFQLNEDMIEISDTSLDLLSIFTFLLTKKKRDVDKNSKIWGSLH